MYLRPTSGVTGVFEMSEPLPRPPLTRLTLKARCNKKCVTGATGRMNLTNAEYVSGELVKTFPVKRPMGLRATQLEDRNPLSNLSNLYKKYRGSAILAVSLPSGFLGLAFNKRTHYET